MQQVLGLLVGVAQCHDTGVILGDASWAACAGGDGYTLWSLDAAHGGSLTDPAFMYSRVVPDVSIGHTATFSFDGEVLVFEHEPGGGVLSECEPGNADSDKSLFFFATATGDQLGMWTLPRAQSAEENCTLHNFNVVPLRSGDDVIVMGNYQAGTWVVDFTDPASPKTIAWSDPPAAPVALVLRIYRSMSPSPLLLTHDVQLEQIERFSVVGLVDMVDVPESGAADLRAGGRSPEPRPRRRVDRRLVVVAQQGDRVPLQNPAIVCTVVPVRDCEP